MEYNNKSFELCEDFIDVGYMAENVDMIDFYGNKKEIKRSHEDKAMTLIVSFPDMTKEFFDEIVTLDEFMKDIQVPIHCFFVFNKEYEQKSALKNQIEKFEIVYDTEEEYGNMYGTKIVSKELEDKLTKALFLVSKDGAVFYLDTPENLSTPLDLTRLQVELNKAYVSYTGVGCHDI